MPAKSKLMKNGIVSGVKMLARGDMVKMPKEGYGAESRFTRVQELKQAQQHKKMPACFPSVSKLFPPPN